MHWVSGFIGGIFSTFNTNGLVPTIQEEGPLGQQKGEVQHFIERGQNPLFASQLSLHFA